jgi:peptidoglycan/LPS O-acetylase OafA/YrhL
MPIANRAMQPRSGVIDVLRGLSIVLVLLNHVNMRLFLAKLSYWQGLPQALHDALVWNGQNGVQIFFALSGYLITATSLRRWGSLSSIRVGEFYALRFARIAPLLLVLLAVLSTLHFVGTPGFVVGEETGGLGRALIAALTFHINWLEAQRGYLPGSWDILWSLSVEEVFYLGFPLVCRLAGGSFGRWVGRGNLLMVILLGFVVMGPFARTVLTRGNEVWREVSYLGGMDAIAMGCLTALLLSRIAIGGAMRAWLSCIGIAGIGYVLSLSDVTLQRTGLDMSLLGLCTCLLVTATAGRKYAAGVTDDEQARAGSGSAAGAGWRSSWAWALGAPLRWLGRRSYEVYLTHMLVVMSGFAVFKSVAMPGGAAVTLLFALVILVSALLGGAVEHYYSEPMNRMVRRRVGVANY